MLFTQAIMFVVCDCDGSFNERTLGAWLSLNLALDRCINIYVCMKLFVN